MWQRLGDSVLGGAARLGWALEVRWRPVRVLLQWGVSLVLRECHKDGRLYEHELSDQARELLQLWWVRLEVDRVGARVVASRIWADQADVPMGFVCNESE